MTRINLDHSFFLIVAQAGGEPVFIERTLQDAASLAETVLDIERGQIDDVHYVIEMNPGEGWSRNVTEAVAEDIARIVNNDFAEDGSRPRREIADFIERHCSIRIPAAAERTFQAA